MSSLGSRLADPVVTLCSLASKTPILLSHCLGGTPVGVEILLVVECYRNRDKLRLDGPRRLKRLHLYHLRDVYGGISLNHEIGKLMSRSEQLPFIPVTAFSQTDLFLD